MDKVKNKKILEKQGLNLKMERLSKISTTFHFLTIRYIKYQSLIIFYHKIVSLYQEICIYMLK